MIGELAVAVALGAVVGAAVARPRHDPLDLDVIARRLERDRHDCGCLADQVRMAHYEQLVGWYQRGVLR